jgi:transcriptional regulator with XRE-family HTH domain
MSKKRARPGEGIPKDVKKAEGKALHDLWKKRHKRTQAEFAADCGFTQGYMQQFFLGLRPLTLDMANQFAEELAVEIHDFSPRLAEELSKELETGVWPFMGFSRSDYTHLTKAQRQAVERLVGDFLVANGVSAHPRIRRLA